MTIGPAPMIRMLFMSLRFGIAHQFVEAIEQIADVVWPRTRFRMPLKTERGTIGPCEPLEGTVEQGYMGRPQVSADRRGIDGEAVVLARDDDLTRVEVLHRMVRPVVTELHLQRLRPGGEAHQLVAEADAEHRDARRVEDLADRLDRVVARLGIARAVGEEYAVRFELQHFPGGHLRGYDRDP